MAKIVTVSNQKGGVGKTTSVAALASGIAGKGYKVLCVDADPQTNLSLISGYDFNEEGTNLDDLLTAAVNVEKIDPDDYRVHSEAMGYDYIPGALRLADADLRFNVPGRDYLLRNALAPFKELYDYIFLDTGPTLGFLVVAALSAADELIVPVGADLLSAQGFGQLMKFVNQIQSTVNPGLKVNGILITRYSGERTTLNATYRKAFKNLADTYQVRLYSAPIRETVSVREAQTFKANLFTDFAKSNAAADYSSFVNEFLEGEKDQ